MNREWMNEWMSKWMNAIPLQNKQIQTKPETDQTKKQKFTNKLIKYIHHFGHFAII